MDLVFARELQKNVLIQSLHTAEQRRKIAADEEDAAIRRTQLKHSRSLAARDLLTSAVGDPGFLAMRIPSTLQQVNASLFPPGPALVVLDAFVVEGRDLFRDDAEQEDQQRVNKEHGAHVGEAFHGEVGIGVPQGSEHEHG